MPLESIFRCFAHEPAPEQRAHLDLQINLLSEGENTKRLQMLQALCAHHGLAIAPDRELEKFASQIDAPEVVGRDKEATPWIRPETAGDGTN